MMARDVMTCKVFSVTPQMTLRQIARILVENRISGVPVVDGEGSPIGMVTENDLIALDGNGEREFRREWWLTRLAEGEPLSPRFLAHLDHADRTARDVMAVPVVTVSDTTELSEIARLLIDYRIKRLPVVRDGRLVGIVSRADLVRRLAMQPAAPEPASHHAGMVSEAIARVEDHFIQSQASPVPLAKAEEPGTVTAKAFGALVAAFGREKAHRHDEERQAATDQRKALVKSMIDHHIEDEKWRDILRRAQMAAKEGGKELLLLRFPCDLCSDGGRAINSTLPDWPATLRGEAAEIYLLWERDLKPQGFHLVAQVLDFPGGIPGDIGLTLLWGEEGEE